MKPALLFIHRSVGRNLIRDGAVYKQVREVGQPFTLSDFDQNTGLLQSDGVAPHVADWRFPGGDTTLADYAELFSLAAQSNDNPTLAAILRYDIIAIKSCYPNSNIKNDREFEAVQAAYQSIATFFARLTGKKLIIVTSPPLIPLLTKHQSASRARRLADWLVNLHPAANVFVFDLFNELAVPVGERQANMLRRQYRRWVPFDAHPNIAASQAIAPLFVAFLQKVTTS